MEFGENSGNHPELLPGEIFKGNVRIISENMYQFALGEPKELGENERFGEQSFDTFDNPTGDLLLRPLFKEESMDFKKTGR